MDPINVDRQGKMHGADTIRRVARPEDPLRDELLLGIPNDITLTYIAPHLPRRAYEEVAKINPDWQRAFQGRMVYDARVRTQVRQEILLVSCHFRTNVRHNDFLEIIVDKRTFSLFSPSEERWYKIPPIPGCQEGVLHSAYSRAVLDGSLYLVGGKNRRKTFRIPSAQVLVLDLARHPLEWRQCANMQVARLDPTVRVMHGKIFVFGGDASLGNFQFEVRNEVYDPKVDTWSFIAPPTPLVSIHEAFSIGKQFFACIGARPSHRVHDFRDVDMGTKFVVTVDDGGPKITSTNDDDAEDDMDGLHGYIEEELCDRAVVPYLRSPAEKLASLIEHCEEYHPGLFFGLYDPVNNTWRDFDKEMLRTATVDEHRQNHSYLLRQNDDGPEPDDDGSDQDDDGPESGDDVKVDVCSISL